MNMMQHLIDRDVDIMTDNFMVDDESNCAVFPLYNLVGQFVGFHQYKPYGPKRDHKHPTDSKYFTYLSKPDHKHACAVPYGLDHIDYSANYLCIVEGIFDYFTLKRAGFNAIAVLMNNPKPMRNLLLCLPFNHIIAVVDGDVAGARLGKFGTKVMHCPPNTDPNELGINYMSNFLGEFINDIN